MYAGAQGGQERTLDPLKLELQVDGELPDVEAKLEPGTSVRTTRVLSVSNLF